MSELWLYLRKLGRKHKRIGRLVLKINRYKDGRCTSCGKKLKEHDYDGDTYCPNSKCKKYPSRFREERNESNL